MSLGRGKYQVLDEAIVGVGENPEGEPAKIIDLFQADMVAVRGLYPTPSGPVAAMVVMSKELATPREIERAKRRCRRTAEEFVVA